MSRWPELPLQEIARLTRGTEPGSESYTDSSKGIRFLRVGDITGKAVRPVFTDSHQLVMVDRKDVLIALDGTPGHVSTGHIGAISSGIRKIEPNRTGKVLLEWLRYSLMSPDVQQTISRYTTGVTIQHASSAVPHIRIPVPPIPEQEKLVRILTDAEELCCLRIQADERTASAVPAIFFEWFGDPTTNKNNLPSAKLGDIAKLERGRFSPRPRNDPSYFDGEYPFIQTGDISDSGGLLDTWKQTLNERGKMVSKEFPAGTIVIAIVGATIGSTAILQIPVYCTDSIVGISVNPKYCLTEYVEFVLRARRPILLAQAPDAARANLNLEILREIPIPIPPIELQQKFVAHVAEIQALQAMQKGSRTRFDDLFQSLLHRAFQGEL